MLNGLGGLGGNMKPHRDSLTCNARARFNYKVLVGPVKGDQCGAYQVRQGLFVEVLRSWLRAQGSKCSG